MKNYMKKLLIVTASAVLATGAFITGNNMGYNEGYTTGYRYSEQNQAKYTLRIHKSVNKEYLDNISLTVFDPKKHDSEEYFFMSGGTSLDQLLNQQHRINMGELQKVGYNEDHGYWENIGVRINPILTLELYQH